VKGNIGHSEQSAGLAGLVKAALVLKHGQIPATLHVSHENPELKLGDTPFFIQKALGAWPDEAELPRRAGVNSLGIGGTNAFAVLESPPDATRAAVADRDAALLCLSARTESALRARVARMAEAVRSPTDAIGDICFTANRSRSSLPYRAAFVAPGPDELQRQLAAFGEGAGAVSRVKAEGAPRGVVFLFSGQGSQYRGMGSALYKTQPTFRAALDACATLLEPELPCDLRELLWSEDASDRLTHTRFTQPAVFSVGYALARMWLSWGVKPAAVLGHSLGEYTAACIAGVLGLEDAIRLVAGRGAGVG